MNMNMRTSSVIAPLLLIVAAGAGTESRAAEDVSLAKLRESTHIHGIAVDPKDSSRIYLATHHGLFVARADGMAIQVSTKNDDLMGFTPHPSDPTVLYASGHPGGGGNLGFIMSNDSGTTWRQISKGLFGPVDFHQMDVSKADPKVIYGAFRGLQVSTDGGHTWRFVGTLPDRLIDLAASAMDVNRVYAATEGGLLVTHDRGSTWQSAYMLRQPATMVHTTDKRKVYAFIFGVGFLGGTEPELRWQTLSRDFGQEFMLHLAVDPADDKRLYGVMKDNRILASTDGGLTWKPFGGP